MSRRRVAVVLGVLAATLIAAPPVVLVAASAAGATLDLSRWRGAVAQRVSVALGREVDLQGPLQLTLGREWVLRAGGVRVASPAGFAGANLATVGQLVARVDMFDAWRGRLRLRELQASDVDLRLERAADGRGNWATASSRGPTAVPEDLELGRVTLKQVSIRYDDAGAARHHRIVLDDVQGSLGPGLAVQLALRGRVDDGPGFALRVDGGSPVALDGAGGEGRRDRPWPFTVGAKAAGAWLHAGGVFDRQRGEARFDFGAELDEAARAGPWFGVRVPALGGAALYGRAVANAQTMTLSHLQGRLGTAEVTGQLALDLGGPRRHLRGALHTTVLDLRPWRSDQRPEDGPGDDGRDGAAGPDDAPAWQHLALRRLVPFDLDVQLQADHALGAGLDLQDLRLALQADARGLRAALGATIAGQAVAGELRLDTAAPVPTLALELDARDLALGALARTLWDAPGLDGRLGHVGLRVAGRGETWHGLVRELELSLALAGLRLQQAAPQGAGPAVLSLDRLELAAAHGVALHGAARGTVLGEPAQLAVRGGTWPDLVRERTTPIEVDVVTAPATLRLAAEAGAMAPALAFDFQAHRAGELARWLPVAPTSALSVRLRGRLSHADDAWHLGATTLSVGGSELQIDARHRRADGRPFTTVSVHSPRLDLPELASLGADVPRPAAGAARADRPWLAGGVNLADADLALDLQHVVLARTHLSDVAVRARTRGGRLASTMLTGRVVGASFAGQAELDLRSAPPRAVLELRTGAIDLGALLRGLGLAEMLEGQVDGLQLGLQARGSSLREWAAGAVLEAGVAGGRVGILGAGPSPVAEIRLREAVLGAGPGEPLRARLDGWLDDTAVHLEARSGSFAEFAGGAARLPFAMTAEAAGARLSLDGDVALPLGREARLNLVMSGDRLDSLNGLARVELPPWGPWSLAGPIRTAADRYDVQDLVLAVGRSRLQGTGTLDLGAPRPNLRVQVDAPTIQLDDFPLPQRLTDLPDQGLRMNASRLAGRIDRLLSRRVLRRFDADIDVRAAEVRSGLDLMAHGEVHLRLREGRLGLAPAVVNLPGGSLRVAIDYDPKESEVDFAVVARVERFDYGIIARRLGRSDDLHGLFSLDLDLAGRAPSLDTIMRHASGQLDVAVWPTELRSGVFDLWSANLVLRLLPLIDPGGQAQVNCVVARLDLRDGEVSDDKMMIDTTTVRIVGTGQADLRTEDLAFVFRPRAKGHGLFRLQTPLRVTGTLYDQRFGFDRRDVFVSALRLIAAPVLVPIEWITVGVAPRDGADVCTDPLRAPLR